MVEGEFTLSATGPMQGGNVRDGKYEAKERDPDLSVCQKITHLSLYIIGGKERWYRGDRKVRKKVQR